MRYIYSCILYLLSPLVLLRLAWLGLRNRGYWSRWGERFGYVPGVHGPGGVIWVHAVSVGEVRASAPLVHRLKQELPQYRILLTTITPTGSATVRQVFDDGVLHCYLPYDLPDAMTRFIRRIRPVLLIVMETELWPNLFHYCRALGVKTLLANARLSRRSLRGYRKLPALARATLHAIDRIAAQTREDGERLLSLGADPERLLVTGNLKFDVHVPHSVSEQAQSLRRFFNPNRPVWIAASTHEGEEAMVLAAHRRILASRPDCLLVIAARHPERFERVVDLSRSCGLRTLTRSSGHSCSADVQVFILDALGELLGYFAASDLAFVGGSLLPFGGHNVLEPASLGVPVVTGPHMHNFAEIHQLLLERGAAIQVVDADQLGEQVARLLADGNLRHQLGQSARTFVEQNRGCTDRVMQLITGQLLATGGSRSRE